MNQPESQHKTHQPESSPRPQQTHTHSHAHCHAPSLTLRTPFAPLGAQPPPPLSLLIPPNNPKPPKSPKIPKIPKIPKGGPEAPMGEGKKRVGSVGVDSSRWRLPTLPLSQYHRRYKV